MIFPTLSLGFISSYVSNPDMEQRGHETPLEEISPREAGNLYVEEVKNNDGAYDTLEKYEKVLDMWYEYTDEAGIDNLNNLSGRDLLKFKQRLQSTTSNGKVSLNGIFAVLHTHIKFCERIEAVRPHLHEKVPTPTVSGDEDVCEDKPSKEQVIGVATFLQQQQPLCRQRVEFELIRETMLRQGAIRGIDVRDVNLDEKYITLRHRPADGDDVRGTPLKNGDDSERQINIPTYICELIAGYLDSPDRPDVADDFGRRPLLTTKHGRPRRTTIRRDMYKIMRPCEYSGTCPHDRSIDSCEATKSAHASKCPSTYSTHPLRRYAIEKHISDGIPKEQICERADVSLSVLNEHYDRRSEEKEREDRQGVLADHREGYGVDTAERHDEDDDDAADHHEECEDDAEAIDTAGEVETDAQQSKFSDFSGIVAQPAIAPLLATGLATEWVPDRLRREHEELSPTDEVQWPTTTRMAKGAAAYSLFVALASINLILLGAIPSVLI